MAWHNSTTPFDVAPGKNHDLPMTIVLEPNGGSAQIQLRDSAGAWFTPDAADFTLTQAGPYRVERANTPGMRIIATGNATFEVTLAA
ncbi:hypothetical protein ROLI_045270 (plasmid) [Roseobacter fucihabitans]|uniref:Uncharacterized protein n=1 Tax=Roseobacter fucihabitans TaxID=1537242 RepID=A0ABZ2BZA8_9RHOB|nr:hypothetical protein [Roseobacter litoralis]MBC6967242.1 hypothetical protein [Roseobacter litoralis]